MALLRGSNARLVVMDDLDEEQFSTEVLYKWFFQTTNTLISASNYPERSHWSTFSEAIATTRTVMPAYVTIGDWAEGSFHFTTETEGRAALPRNSIDDIIEFFYDNAKKDAKPMTHQRNHQRFFDEIDRIMESISEKNIVRKIKNNVRNNLEDEKAMMFEFMANIKDEFEERQDDLSMRQFNVETSYNPEDHLRRRIKRTKISRTYAKDLLTRLIKKMNEHEASEDQLVDNIQAVKERDIFSDLITLNNIYPFDPETNAWSLPDYILTDDFTEGEHVIYGLKVRLNPTAEHIRDGLQIIPPDNMEETKGYFHPHINEYGRICLGDAEYPAQVFWKKCNYVALFQLIDSLLGTYNDESPYVKLKIFINGEESPTCASCGEELDPDDHLEHHNGAPGCEDCLTYVNGEYYWDEDLVYSEEYGRDILGEDAVEVVCGYSSHPSEPLHSWMYHGDDDVHMCEFCGEYIHSNLAITSGLIQSDYECLCEKCVRDHFVRCCECSDIIKETDAKFANLQSGEVYCEDCAEQCRHCNKWFDFLESDGLCDKCREKEEQAA